MNFNYKEYFEDLKDCKSIVLSSIDLDGYPANRSMLVIKKKWSKEGIYFSTNTSSEKIAHFLLNDKASIYYSDSNSFIGFYLRGKISIHQDIETKSMFWEEGDEKYYPLGKKDPDYSIIRFLPMNGKYYFRGKTVRFDSL